MLKSARSACSRGVENRSRRGSNIIPFRTEEYLTNRSFVRYSRQHCNVLCRWFVILESQCCENCCRNPQLITVGHLVLLWSGHCCYDTFESDWASRKRVHVKCSPVGQIGLDYKRRQNLSPVTIDSRV